MKLLFTGSTTCNLTTLKRLLLVADEIGFLDRPCVTLPQGGTIGVPCPWRHIDRDGYPVKISVHTPPSGRGMEALYHKYIETDFLNPDFKSIALDALSFEDFASKVIQLRGEYSVASGRMSGEEIIQELIKDKELRTISLSGNIDKPTFLLQTFEQRVLTLKTLLFEASIQITGAMTVSEETGLIPVTDTLHMAKLMSLRMSHPSYVGDNSTLAPQLGMEITKAVIPDDALVHLLPADIMTYRHEARDSYIAWSVEINKLASELESMGIDEIQKSLPALMAEKINPKILEYENEMKSVRDKLFGDLIKRITTWQFPALSLAYLAQLDANTAMSIFAASTGPVINSLIDYLVARKKIKRGHAMAYLIGIKPSK